MSARRIAWLLLSLALWLSARTGLPSEAAVELRWAEASVRLAALTRALESAEEPVRAAVWAVERVEERSLAVYIGDPLLLTGGRMRHGSALVCAVSESAALDIWGSQDVVGLTLTLKGKDYTVGGVYPSGVADVLMAWDGASEHSFKQMAVRFPGQEGGVQLSKARGFASSAGMGEPDEVLDAPLLQEIARAVALLPGWMLMLLTALWQGRALRGVRVMHVPVRVPIIALSLIVMVLASGISLAPPKWLLPTRWSNFAHWGALLGEVADRLNDFLGAAHNPLNSQDLYASLRVTAQGILSVALLYDIRGGDRRARIALHD